jgi:cytochrome c biogenesis protein ResB
VTDAGVTQKARIQMNEPLRYKGLVFFQSGWGEMARGKYTVLAVVQNPSDQWPLWACIVITLGLTIHFSRLLFRYVRREAREAT